jgi:BTB/POZ domain
MFTNMKDVLTVINRFLGRDIVHIKVDDGHNEFFIHETLLSQISPYFKAVLASISKIGHIKVLVLETIGTSAFSKFYYWIYNGIIDQNEDWDDGPCYNTLLKLYEFAHMAKISALKNATVRCLYDEIMRQQKSATGKVTMDPEFLFDVLSSTEEFSPLRRMIVDLCVWRLDGETLFAKEKANILTPHMTLEILRAMSKKLLSKHYMPNPLLNLSNYDEPVL